MQQEGHPCLSLPLKEATAGENLLTGIIFVRGRPFFEEGRHNVTSQIIEG